MDLNKKIIILDRDGVINQDSAQYIKSPEEWVPISGSIEAIAKLSQHDFRIFIATNQSGIGRGLLDLTILKAIHNKLEQSVINLNGKIEAIFFCPHLPSDGCYCRKPNVGLLKQIAHYCQTDLNQVPFVGDSYKDIQAARAFNCKPVLVLTGNGIETKKKYKTELDKVAVFKDLASFVEHLLQE